MFSFEVSRTFSFHLLSLYPPVKRILFEGPISRFNPYELTFMGLMAILSPIEIPNREGDPQEGGDGEAAGEVEEQSEEGTEEKGEGQESCGIQQAGNE